MAPVVAIQLVFALLAAFGIETSSAPESGFILLSCLDTLSQKSTAPCLVRGSTTTRRDDFTYTPGIGGHRVHSGLASWNAGRRICKDQGSYLTVINSVAEAKLVGRLLKETAPNHHAWVGVHDLYQEDEFVTIHGESLADTGYEVWRVGEPNNLDNNEHCVVITAEGKFVDVPCAQRRSVICEIP